MVADADVAVVRPDPRVELVTRREVRNPSAVENPLHFVDVSWTRYSLVEESNGGAFRLQIGDEPPHPVPELEPSRGSAAARALQVGDADDHPALSRSRMLNRRPGKEPWTRQHRDLLRVKSGAVTDPVVGQLVAADDAVDQSRIAQLHEVVRPVPPPVAVPHPHPDAQKYDALLVPDRRPPDDPIRRAIPRRCSCLDDVPAVSHGGVHVVRVNQPSRSQLLARQLRPHPRQSIPDDGVAPVPLVGTLRAGRYDEDRRHRYQPWDLA